MMIRRVMAPISGQAYPLFIETIGYNPEQEPVVREDAGYPYYHWIQTNEGVGELRLGDHVYLLPPSTGALLSPGDPHRYEATGAVWSTVYITFGGALVEEILRLIGLGGTSAFYRWNKDSPLQELVEGILHNVEENSRFSALDGSMEVYRFVTELKKHGQPNNRLSPSRIMEGLEPLLQWLEEHFADPSIGVNDMAQRIGVTPRHMNTLFREAFGLSPYAYLVLLRIRKAKGLLLNRPELTVKTVSDRVGFRDTSHFVASFRKHAGITPETFRKYH
ncbi:AraC family transcriptional regulator [Gorillibacterium massiliense]|uniref:AraC family transcriptional regulator n=1 Tax=Gorillibacterium massiliense TaxID=1280390 RepID=UPI0004BAE15C|nr:AraC family transcriptional regulator [Gorillibacterium massiliense]